MKGSVCRVLLQRALGKRHLVSPFLQLSVSNKQIIPPALCSSTYSKPLSTAATSWNCLMVSLHIPLCPGRVFPFP